MKLSKILLLLLLGLSFCTERSWAGMLALTPTTVSDSQAPYPLTTGWGFYVNQSITVNALDYYDAGQNGLLESHEVGIFSTDVFASPGTLLVSAIIPAGTAVPLNGIYRSVTVTPLTLTPGYYVMAGFTSAYTDPYIVDSSPTPTTIPEITLLPSAYLNYSSPGFDYPTPRSGGYHVGANFEAVPEPSTFALVYMGALSLLAHACLLRKHGA